MPMMDIADPVGEMSAWITVIAVVVFATGFGLFSMHRHK